jgi:NAD(P)-dependent dehydrogenase (short-subunit alcohol dehydrogenase family)
MTRLAEGAAIVTGGGSGIGRAISLALAAEGAPVAVLDLQPKGGQETVALIEAAGGKASYVPVDVRHWEEVDRAFAEARGAVGGPGIVVNAAGILDGYAQADAVTNVLGLQARAGRSAARWPDRQHRLDGRAGWRWRRPGVHRLEARRHRRDPSDGRGLRWPWPTPSAA